ncbi:MAG TPA: hypothetical protein VEJ63_15905 [Planctomycetota bacterium]|nr:hypothetical protein [Planctomycetota bacterium]
MASRARVVVILTYHEDTRALDAFMGDENPEFGAAVRVVETDSVTVGVGADGRPVFIRVTDAHRLNNTFRTIAKYAQKEQPLSALQWRHVFQFCLSKANEVLDLDNNRRKPKVAKFVFSSVPAAV